MRKAKLPKKEVEICERLRWARDEVLGITQAICAEQVGLDRSTLANYESCRTPLRYDIALRFCRQFIISEEWLATGRFDACHQAAELHGIDGKKGWDFFDRKIFIRQSVDLLSLPATLHIKPGTLFSEAFSGVLASHYAELVMRFFYSQPILLSDADKPELAINFLKATHERQIILLNNEALRIQIKQSDMWRLYTRYMFECANLVFRKLMAGGRLQPDYLRTLEWLRAAVTDPDAAIGPPHVMVGEHPRGLDPRDSATHLQKTTLDEVTVIRDTADVPSAMKQLLARLNAATEATGKKAELAAFLKVPRQRITEWLAGKPQPNGETTLQLLNWVEQQERKK